MNKKIKQTIDAFKSIGQKVSATIEDGKMIIRDKFSPELKIAQITLSNGQFQNSIFHYDFADDEQDIEDVEITCQLETSPPYPMFEEALLDLVLKISKALIVDSFDNPSEDFSFSAQELEREMN